MNSHFRVSLLSCAGVCLLLPGCAPAPEMGSPHAQIANPASVHCVRLGGKLESGDEAGFCHLPDGRVIDEWELFRRDHRVAPSEPHD